MYDRIVTIIRDRQSTFASGLAALLIIVGGFLVFNYFAGQTKIKAPQVSPPSTESAELNQNQGFNPPSSLGSQTQTPPTSYLVVRGDNLSAVAKKFYGDGNKWVEIAKANNLAKPSVIHAGNILKIPVISASPAPTSQAGTPATLGSQTTTVQRGSNYTVKSGDTLWDIAMAAYGSGYEWYRIDQANAPIPRNVNGKPLILPGQVLRVP